MSEYDAGLHAEHAVAPTATKNVPGKHDEHAVALAFAANLPASQTSHWTDAEVLEYVPATQSWHMAVVFIPFLEDPGPLAFPASHAVQFEYPSPSNPGEHKHPVPSLEAVAC